MEHHICLNLNSFPATSSQQGFQLFNDSIQGILSLNGGHDRFTILADLSGITLNDFEIAAGYSIEDYKLELENQNERDALVFWAELEDKSPAMSYLDNDTIEDIASYNFFIPNQPIDCHPEVFGIAWFKDVTLLSINTNAKWNNDHIIIDRVDDTGRYLGELLKIKNIASPAHGAVHRIQIKASEDEKLRDVGDNMKVSPEVDSWFDLQTKEDKRIILRKLAYSCERKFQGGKPLFETLQDGIREIRFNAYSGGTFRVLFKLDATAKAMILNGFYKKRKDEGYVENIADAKTIFREMTG